MLVSLSWLKEYVDLALPPPELAHRLTMAGVEVGEVVPSGGWAGCVVGEVLEVQPHPNADSLHLCRVKAGDGIRPAAATETESAAAAETESAAAESAAAAGIREVVCGAPNVAAGQKICLAQVGARLYNARSGRPGNPQSRPHPRRGLRRDDLLRTGVGPGQQS